MGGGLWKHGIPLRSVPLVSVYLPPLKRMLAPGGPRPTGKTEKEEARCPSRHISRGEPARATSLAELLFVGNPAIASGLPGPGKKTWAGEGQPRDGEGQSEPQEHMELLGAQVA